MFFPKASGKKWKEGSDPNGTKNNNNERVDMQASTESYKSLASAIIQQALADVLIAPAHSDGHTPDRTRYARTARRKLKKSAIDFLFHVSSHRVRSMWLSWLNMTETDLWAMLAKTRHQGHQNLLHATLRPHLVTVGALNG